MPEVDSHPPGAGREAGRTLPWVRWPHQRLDFWFLGLRCFKPPRLCYFLKQPCAQSLSHVRLFATPRAIARQPPLSLEFPGKNTRVGYHFLLQGIFPTQGSNPHLLHLLHWQVGSLPLCCLKGAEGRGVLAGWLWERSDASSWTQWHSDVGQTSGCYSVYDHMTYIHVGKYIMKIYIN